LESTSSSSSSSSPWGRPVTHLPYSNLFPFYSLCKILVSVDVDIKDDL
jgi:hypothetical protein